MSLTIEQVRFGTKGELSGYLARPTRAAGPLPGIIVIQEAWGVDEHIEDVTRRFAAAGYLALAPDLYAENGVRAEALTHERTEEVKRFFGELGRGMTDPAARDLALTAKGEPTASRLRTTMAAAFSDPTAAERRVAILAAAARHLRTEHALTKGQKIGSVGFCMGGALSALLSSADPELAGAVVFYGSAPSEEKIAQGRCPILAFYGALDERINPSIPGFEKAMTAHGRSYERHVYPGAMHAFFNDTRPSYDAAASRDAFARTLEFFRTRLT